MARRKLFIDTDAGTDDAVALIMALQREDVDVIGISAVCGNVALEKVVQNIGYVCELCRKPVPYYAGSAQPLNRILVEADFIHGKDGLGDIGLDLAGRKATTGDAIEVLIEMIHQYPNELELICLGPLTNIARLTESAPDLLQLLKKIVIMGGLVHLPGNVTPKAEFNIWADPEAASIVLDAIQKQNVDCMMVGWDSTLTSSNLSLEELNLLATIPGPLAKFATAIQAPRIKWLRHHHKDVTVNLADVLAMAAVLDERIITSRGKYRMKVETGLEDPALRGYIRVTPVTEPPYIDFIHSVDRKRYLGMIHSCLELTTKS